MNRKRLKYAGVSGHAMVLLFLLASSPAVALYSGGAGTEPNPYRIGSIADWTTLALTTDDWNKYFILVNDLDFGGDDVTPVGAFDEPFIGVFDGNGYVLRNFRLNFPEALYIGIFCVLGAGGEIRNLGLEGADVTGHRYVGSLVGRNDGGIVTSCHTAGTVIGANPDTGTLYIGGLAGENNGGTLTACFSMCTVTAGIGSNYIGGLVGRNKEGTLQSCYATGTVTGTVDVGALAGLNDGGAITSCCAVGAATGANHVGGLVGYNSASASISYCYSTAAVVAGGSCSGGLVGSNHGSITSCYARGAVAGESVAGGLVGENYMATVSQCYSTGVVTGRVSLGGLVGEDGGGTITACYWDTDLSGQTVSDGGTGRTSDEMTHPHAANAYVGWDFLTTWASDTEYSENDGYPYLADCVVPAEGEVEGENESAEGEGESSEGEGEAPAEGEGEAPAEGEGEGPAEGESEGEDESAEGEGEPGEGEGAEGEEEACGCCKPNDKNLTPEELLEKTLGDWLLVGLSLAMIAVLSLSRK